MKRFFALGAGLLVVAASLFGCAGNANRASAGWVTLIDGPSGLADFVRLGEANWREQDGAVMADKGGKEPSYLVTRASFTDFVLYAEFWGNDDANSGILIRLSDREKITSTNSYAVQINDKHSTFATSSVVNFAKASPLSKAGGRWNTFEITAIGPRVIVKMNGQQTVDMSDRSFFHGPFSLQYGSGVVKFRKVQIKPL